MSVGLVYLRPVRIAGVRVEGPCDEVVERAWNGLNDWILRKSLSDDVDVGYGLIQQNSDGSLTSKDLCYEAGIKLPDIVTPGEANELHRTRLQGGAYYRSRFSGPVSNLHTEFDGMLARLKEDRNLRIDIDRPLVTVLVDLNEFSSEGEVRSNLLVPVLVGDMSRGSRQAA